MEINTNYQANKEVFEVLHRVLKFRRRKLGILSKIYENRDFKNEQLKKVFARRGMNIKKFDKWDKFLIEDPKKYENMKWKDSGGRRGYDNRIVVYTRPGPRYFKFYPTSKKTSTWITNFDSTFRNEWKSERKLDEKIIKTIDKTEAINLMNNKHELINTFEDFVSNHDGDHDLGTSYSKCTVYVLARNK